ncbi:MAG: CDP-alcohol phosphatidyltransferase family protein [Salibacteraceae bacterium]
MNAIIRFVPNLFTLGNVLMGFLAIIFIANERMLSAVVCIGIALVLDFLDGFVARLLHAQSELGKQLDSLADAITFGVVPGFILFQMIVITKGYYFVEINEWPFPVLLQASVAGLVPMAAVFRLATFNIQDGHQDHFLGLPTPAMTMFVVSIPLMLEANYHLNFYHPLSDQFIQVLGEIRKWDASDMWLVALLNETITYQIIALILAVLLVSRIPMLSLKFKGITWALNKWRYFLIGWALVCYVIFLIPYFWKLPINYGLIDYLILPIFMIGYFILSFIYATFGGSKETQLKDEV